MRFAFRLLVAVVLVLALVPGTASATHVPDQSNQMNELFTSPNGSTNSDFAFWGNYAFSGYYTADSNPSGGVRIFDISNPRRPKLVRNLKCDGLQADPIVWDTDDNGVPDLLLLAVDRTMTRQVASVYTDCGAHTITANPQFAERRRNPRLLVYVSSYPLRAGPTCGNPEYTNTSNPYDEDPGSPNSPLHGVIQVVEVPLDNPEESNELDVQPRIRYPGDPDRKIEWCERGLCSTPESPLEDAAIACHDIVVHVEHRIAGAACAEQGQVWRIRRNGIPDTRHPMSVGDDEVTSGGTGQFPGAVDFFHSVMFDNEGETVNWVDESFGSGCPTMTEYNPRPWNPAGGTHKTGRMFFSDMEGNFQSEFHVGDVRPDPGETEYCSAHMGMAVMGIEEDLLVNAWYTGGVDVIDFTDPENLEETAFFDPQADSGTWSAYPYTGPLFRRGRGIPVYASDGVENNAIAKGMVVYRARNIEAPHDVVDHLNPQTMDHEMP
jgi:hypothetical protein